MSQSRQQAFYHRLFFRMRFSEAPSGISGLFALFYIGLIIGVSLYPFSNWRSLGVPFWGFLTEPWTHYPRPFDILLNALAYLPLGFSLALAYGKRSSPGLAGLLSLVVATLLSLALETLQNYLPARVASKEDWLLNTAGAALGAGMALWARHWPMFTTCMLWRHRFFAAGRVVDFGIVVWLMWLLAQSNPGVPLFGVVLRAPDSLPIPYTAPVEDAALFLRVLEGGGVALHVLALGMMLGSLCAQRQWMLKLVLASIGLAMLVKMLIAGAILTLEGWLAWLSLPLLSGLALGGLGMVLALKLHRAHQPLLCLLALLGLEITHQLWPLPSNAQDLMALFHWRYGHLNTFNGLTYHLGLSLPGLMALYCWLRLWGFRREAQWSNSRLP